MSAINVTDITVLSTNDRFADPYRFKITFECISPLEEDLEWKLIYVGSAENANYDQELDSCMVGPVPIGVNSFEFEAAAPAPSQIPAGDLIGVTVILLTASYNDQEFVRIGYYVNTEYDDEELRLQDPLPDPPLYDRLTRSVLADKPRVTRFNIKWDGMQQGAQQALSESNVTAASATQRGQAGDMVTAPTHVVTAPLAVREATAVAT